MKSPMRVHERILDGIKQGVKRHWRYTKNLRNIKPEYLLTISVADELTEGFDGICGLDLEIRLEEPTKAVSVDLMITTLGYQAYFKSPKHKVKRKGKVDIYVKHNDATSWVVELKGFDPSATETNKEMVRLIEFLEANNGSNHCAGCFLAFPTLTDRKNWIEKKLEKLSVSPQLRITLLSERVVTDEGADDGIPVYYANCIGIVREDVLS